MYYNCVWRTKSISPSKFKVYMVTYIHVLRQIVLSFARVMVIGGTSDLKWFSWV